MQTVAYSYLRFSTPQQATGDSRRRQTALAEEYAQKHNLALDRSLNFRDLGVSAYRGKNAKQGGLRAFLDAVEHGLVPANSHLLVESLDRLSRDQILEAQGLFLQIITAGVTIVTLMDQRSYSAASLNANPTDLIISLVYMMRANEESATKSARIRAAWVAKRDAAGSRYHGQQCPSWLVGKEDKSGYRILPEQAAIIQRIYRETLRGDGLQLITRRLNQESVPMLGRGNQRGKIWQRALIRHIVKTDLVIGTYTPCEPQIVNGKTRYIPLAPRPGYYPAIVSREDWETIQARRHAWSEHHKCKTRRPTVANVIARLGRCPMCDRPMVMQRSDVLNQRYLTCMSWRESRTCSNEWVRYPEIEDVFISGVETVISSCPQPQLHPEARRVMLRSIKSKLASARRRLEQESSMQARLSTVGREGRTWALETQAEIDDLLRERYNLRADRNYWADATLKLKLEAYRSAVGAVPRDVARVNAALLRLLLKVVIDWPNARLILHWRHGGQTVLPFYRKRQRARVSEATQLTD